MPCYIMRANKLRLKVPQDENIELEMMKATGSLTHDELEGKIKEMSDREFIQIMGEIMRRRKKKRGEASQDNGTKVLHYA